jgi:hypothetical protein
MPQELDPVDAWELWAESKELIPLTVETYSASTGLWSETTDYDVCCVPVGARPGGFVSPTSDAGDTGYLMDGPTLGASGSRSFVGFYRIDGSVQDPIKPAFTLKLS